MPSANIAILMLRETAYTRHVAVGVTAFGREHGWRIGLVAQQLEGVCEHLHQWRANGVVTCAFPAERLAELATTGLPVVATNTAGRNDLNSTTTPTPTPGPGPGPGPGPIPRIIPDHDAIGVLAAEHVLRQGFRRFATIAQPDAPFARQRNAAFARTIREARGVDPAAYEGPVHHGQVAEVAFDSGAMGAWLAALTSHGEPLAVFAYWDAAARQVLNACEVAGLAVPQRVAVLGVDNDPLLCELADPPLSSIDLGAQRIGERAARLLEGLINGEPPPTEPITIPPLRVVGRLSTDLIAVEDAQVASAVRYLREHAHQPIQVTDAAEHVGVPQRTLERRFRAALGSTMHAELTRCRLDIARQLLTGTTLSIERIAPRCGYASGPHLSKTFHRHVGQTPGAYRGGHVPSA